MAIAAAAVSAAYQAASKMGTGAASSAAAPSGQGFGDFLTSRGID